MIEIKNRFTNATIFTADADLAGANLREANLRGANLREANLTHIRDDLWAVLSAAPHEARGLRDAIAAGKIDGCVYEGECACLVGTIANCAKIDYRNLPVLKPNSSRPAEVLFFAIDKGDTPQTSQFSKLAHEWTCQWIDAMESAFAK